MSSRLAEIKSFWASSGGCVLIRVAKALGSVPREAGTWMMVSREHLFGTIGGGQLEFLAIDHARKLLAGEKGAHYLNIPLGPGIGQCCGGRVELTFDVLDEKSMAALLAEVAAEEGTQPHVYVFGAGHVGRALAAALAPLPYQVTAVETRPDLLSGVDVRISRRASPMPEAVVRSAPAGSAFVAVTHDHALDFMITREALLRGDARYVGMIGSATKHTQFKRWFVGEGGDERRMQQLTCPIGSEIVDDKRPEIIAAMTAAELVASLAGKQSVDAGIVDAHVDVGEGI